MRSIGKAILKHLKRAEEVISASLLAAIVLLTLIQVVARYVFSAPFVWSEEAARYSYVALTFIAATLVSANDSHIKIELFDTRLPPRVRLVLTVLSDVAVLIACALFVFLSWDYVARSHSISSPALHMPMSLLYGTVYAAFGAMALHTLVHLAQRVHKGTSVEKASPNVQGGE